MPLHKLTTAALQIGKGNLDTRIDVKSKDEIGILAEAFNRMTRDLSKTTVSKTYVDNIIKSMLDTLIVIDSQATITKVNRSTLDLLGFDREELIGRPIRHIIAGETSKDELMIDELLTKGSVVNVEKTYVTKSGVGIPVLFSGAVMYGEKKSIQGIVCVARDIVERKQSELALQRAYGEMERRVEKRTEDLVAANRHLKMEIEERSRTEAALRESENRLRRVSSHILSAQEKERQRLSMELHDDLGQSLSLLKVQLSAIELKMGRDRTRWLDDFVETRQYLDFIIENVRRLSRDLSPSILEDLGLTAALKWLTGDFAKHHELTPRLRIENVDDCFSRDNQIIIYRIFQEIFANIGKHARAGSFKVEMTRSEDTVRFAVQDNGKGFDEADISTIPTPEKGIGLAAMKERALMLGSELEIWSLPGSGTRVAISVPV
jgi:PAS domain S-box-containing protein